MIETVFFWMFVLMTGVSSLGLFLAPKRSHESTLRDPEHAYRELGFSSTAVEMLHNVLRGQAAALLSLTIVLLGLGPSDRRVFLFMAVAAGLTLVTHVMTARHHARDPIVMRTLGNLRPIYTLIAINAFFALGGLLLFLV